MRVEIGVFFADSPLTEKDALQRYRAHGSEPSPDTTVEPGPLITAFLTDLTGRYPRLGSLSGRIGRHPPGLAISTSPTDRS